MDRRTSYGFARPDAAFRSGEGREEEEIPLEAYAKATKILEERDDMIDPASFARFDQAMIRRDQERVAKKKIDIEAQQTPKDKEIKRAADAFEVIFTEQAELSDWLGSDTMIRKASEYDDLFHGIDSIAEFSREDGTTLLALGMDVTSSEMGLEKKLGRIKRSIDEGHLSEIRYFQSLFEDGSLRFEGSVFNVPLAIIAVERKIIAELAKLWVKKDSKALANHPVQGRIIEQLELQMDAFMQYAKRTGKKNLVAPLMEVLERIREIKRSKQKTGSKGVPAYPQDNTMGEALNAELKRLFGVDGNTPANKAVSVVRRVA